MLYGWGVAAPAATPHLQKRKEQGLTGKVDYTEQEWMTIVAALPNATAAVMMADATSVAEVNKEAAEVSSGLKQGYQENELINACLHWLEQDWNMAETRETTVEMLEVVKQAGSIVDGKAPVAEAQGFKQFILSMAEKTAHAFAEKAGKPVSDREAMVLDQLKAALGL
jgi:hypothetical protein